jgi:F-type H+-transporting ATPase subunit gamma
MTLRLAEVSARIEGIRQLGAVVNAMRGIAAARAQQARAGLPAVDGYAAAIAAAIARARPLVPAAGPAPAARPALVLFAAQQGFAGAFSERVLDAAKLPGPELFLIGSRGIAAAAARGITPAWHAAMPSHAAGIPRLADRIAEALYAAIAAGRIGPVEVAFTIWQPAQGPRVERHRLVPPEPQPAPVPAAPPLLNLAPAALLADLTADHVHARLCHAALHAFAAENEARMAAMVAAHAQIDRRLTDLRATQRQIRQDEITAEIIELAAGEAAGQVRR